MVIEYTHFYGLAVAERLGSRMPSFAPLRLALQSHPHVSEHDDLIANDDEPLRLAGSFGPSAARL